LQVTLDAAAASAALIATLFIRFEFRIEYWFPQLLLWVPVLALLQPLALLALRAYHCIWRHFHLADGLELAIKSSAMTAVLLLFRALHGFGLGVPALPYSAVAMDYTLFLLFAGSLRILRRLTYSAVHPANEPTYRTLLIADKHSLAGAVRLVEPYADFQLVGIISDETEMQGRSVAGVPVLGNLESLQRTVVANHVELVLMSGSGGGQASEVVTKAGELGVQIRILPSCRDLIRNRVRVSHSLSIEQTIKDRNGHMASHPDVIACLHQRSVLVTGAGGSIGSEISRQVAQLSISKLILLDQDENSIFELTNELGATHDRIIPYVGDIRDRRLLEEICALHAPDVVLHAAAYKHVPVMEANPAEAVLNNVAATRLLIDVAAKYGCERFVMISTDKAVHPSSIMGATKRTAEITVQARAARYAGARLQFACVRFGNVVGSRGSVVPIFLRQIAAGGPVTITNEEMTRYFMTIPQAVQLVLQAATLASTGDVYMLDMGDPIKIVDLARDLIRMSGLQPDVDIAIKVIGSRPGEKLHEQLWREDAEVVRTPFPYVYRVKAKELPPNLEENIARLEKAAANRAPGEVICDLLQALPIDYVRDRRAMIVPVKLTPRQPATVRAAASGD
jgi:FlaA1/EpsC-like NDP-sugar epimerase